MACICTVTKSTYASLLNYVAEKLIRSEAHCLCRPRSRRRAAELERWQKVESWLKVRMHQAVKA